jgi:uroporphyrinogen-III decarboxylase
VEIEEAVGQIGGRIFIKGNLDSVNVLLRGSAEKVESETLRCLRAGSEAGGFILSSACSVAPMVPPENIKRMVEVARKYQPE